MKKQLNYTLGSIIIMGFCIGKTLEAAGQTLPASDTKIDLDIITIPFKIRPGLSGFPSQLNANLSTALYFGKRKELQDSRYGYGLFAGLGSVTMNPYVTLQAIDYEYDGFVSSVGIAGIYDTKRFNVGLALGIDHLMDRNKETWIYQHQPWIGILFGINLN